MARDRIQGKRFLTGEPDEYQDPAGAVGFQVMMLLREYAQAGGDLMNAQVTLGSDSLGEGARKHAYVRLDGYGIDP